jgi:hypothetical protein
LIENRKKAIDFWLKSMAVIEPIKETDANYRPSRECASVTNFINQEKCSFQLSTNSQPIITLLSSRQGSTLSNLPIKNLSTLIT